MYDIGDMIVYGQTGVCEVTGTCEKEITRGAGKKLYYTLRPVYQNNSTIFSPAENPKVYMRPVISKEEAEHLIELIPSMTTEAYHSSVQREIIDHYEAALQSHNCSDLIELTMSIYAKKQAAEEIKRKIGSVDERFMKRAEDLLFGELAVALGISIEQVGEYISSKLGK